MNVYLMRHGETDWNKQGLMQGSADIPLNAYGRELAQVTAEGLCEDGVRFDCIFSSPYIRALQTAAIIAERTLIAKATETHSPLQMISRESGVMVDSRIREMSFGKYEGIRIAELRTNEDYIEINKCFDDPIHYVSEPPAESYDQVFNRVCSFLKKEIFPLQDTCENVLVVCHGAVIRAFISVIKRLMLSQYWTIHQPNCSICIARVSDKEISMIEENRLYYEPHTDAGRRFV